MMSEKGRKKTKHAFEDWDDYSATKLKKLDEQFRNDVENESLENTTKIFEGVSIFVNGYTVPSANELKRLMMLNGGKYHYYYKRNKTTHIIASNLPYSKIKNLRGERVVKPEWIVDSLKAGHLLPYHYYLLYPQSKFHTKLNLVPISKCSSSFNRSAKNSGSSSQDKTQEDSRQLQKSDELNQKESDLWLTKDLVDGLKSDYVDKSLHQTYPPAEAIRESPPSHDPSLEDDTSDPPEEQPKDKSVTSCSAVDNPHFIKDFFAHSRLHHISTWAGEFRNFVYNLQNKNCLVSQIEIVKKLISKQNDLLTFSNYRGSNNQRIIMHIDMDCFFVSVNLQHRPDLIGKPVAVTHSKGQTEMINGDGKEDTSRSSKQFSSMAEIASCSYEARKAGVKNGMFVGEAKSLCPELQTISYNFEDYRRAAQEFYSTVAKFSFQIEAVSCDELFVDCTDIVNEVGIAPLDLASLLRHDIKERTKCNASAGIASNVLLARLATRVAKPNGQYHLTDDAVDEFMISQNVENLPGVGRSLRNRLFDINVKTCGDLQRLPLEFLQRKFGLRTGQILYDHCRGVDDKSVGMARERKSVSAEVNYGIRFTKDEESKKFINELAEEVSRRLLDCGMKGKSIVLKLKVRSANAPLETAKYMGHGICDNVAKSCMLPFAVNDAQIIGRECNSLLQQLHINCSDLRGIGIQVSRLEPITKAGSSVRTMLDYFKQQENIEELPDKTDHFSVYEDELSNGLESKFESIISDDTTFSQEYFEDLSNQIQEMRPPNLKLPDKDLIPKNSSQKPSCSHWNTSPSRSLASPKIEALPSLSQLDPMCLKALPPELLQELREAYGDPDWFAQENLYENDKSSLKKPAPKNYAEDPLQDYFNPHEMMLMENFDENKGKNKSKKAKKPNLCGAVELQDVKDMMTEWLDTYPVPEQEDVDMFLQYLSELVGDFNLEQLDIVFRYFCRLIKRYKYAEWIQVYHDVITHIQTMMKETYGSQLKIPVMI